jgi:leucyl aminopeptidase (aminopeptidase T)
LGAILRFNGAILKAAKAAINDVLDAKKGETMLIITNLSKDVFQISKSLYHTAANVGANPVLMVQPVKTHFEFVEQSVLAAMRSEPQIILSISKIKLGKDPRGIKEPYKSVDGREFDNILDYLLHEKRTRAFWAPGITLDIFKRTVSIDYSKLRKTCAKLSEKMKGAKEIEISTKRGTDMVIGINGRKPHRDDGDYRSPGSWGNLPSGEIFISPELGSSNGIYVVDGSLTVERKTLKIKEPVRIKVKNGFVVGVSGGMEARVFKRYLEKSEKVPLSLLEEGKISKEKAEIYVKNTKNLGEFGVGLNPNAKITGNLLEDEKVLGTAHIAVGSNYDGDAPTLIHSDGVFRNPTVKVDGEMILKYGRMKL